MIPTSILFLAASAFALLPCHFIFIPQTTGRIQFKFTVPFLNTNYNNKHVHYENCSPLHSIFNKIPKLQDERLSIIVTKKWPVLFILWVVHYLTTNTEIQKIMFTMILTFLDLASISLYRSCWNPPGNLAAKPLNFSTSLSACCLRLLTMLTNMHLSIGYYFVGKF